MAYTVEKEIDGDTREIEVSEDELGDNVRVLPEDRIGPGGDFVRTDYMESEISRRLDGKVDADDARQQLKEDEDFVNEILNEHGGDDERVQKLQAELEKKESALTEREEKLQQLEQRDRASTIEQAAREAGIDERFLTAPDGANAPIHAMLDGRTERTDDGDIVPLDDEGNRIPAPSDKDRTYATMEDFFQRESWDEYREEQEKTSGSGFGGSGDGNSKSWSEMSPEERSDLSISEKVAAMEADPNITN
jgi:uncharacterized protein YbcI